MTPEPPGYAYVHDPAPSMLLEAFKGFADSLAPPREVQGLALVRYVEDCSLRAILFAAIAAEAYVNAFLNDHLAATDFKVVDKLGTVEKYVVGTRLATGRELFPRGREPIGKLKRLFKLRDNIVHAKKREIQVDPSGSVSPSTPGRTDHTPTNAADLILAVVEAATWLHDNRAASAPTVDDPIPGQLLNMEQKIRSAAADTEREAQDAGMREIEKRRIALLREIQERRRGLLAERNQLVHAVGPPPAS